MEVLRRDFRTEDLRPLAKTAGVTGLVAVQACQSIEETSLLLEGADEHEEILGVVGWVPLAAPDAGAAIERFAGRQKLRGVRHVLQDEPDDEYMLREDFNEGISRLRTFGLAYDLLILERHLPATLTFVDRHPQQVFVLDHMAKPRIREGLLSPWKELMTALAARPNVWCKVSGLVTEADWTRWTEADLRPYFDVALSTFGPRRLMFGSDWPVLTLGCAYGRWVETFRSLCAALSADERAWIEERTARQAYGLG